MGVNENNNPESNRQTPKSVVIIADDHKVDTPLSAAVQGSPKARKDFQRSQHHFSPREQRRKVYGVRQLRRCENLNFLLRQGEKDEDESGEVDFVDLVSHHNSAFQELFMEQDKMSAWMSFVDSSEEEQQRVLTAANKAKLHDIFHYVDSEEDDSDGMMSSDEFEHVGSTAGLTPTPTDGQQFAATANDCFLRINRNLRGFLRRNRFPTGELHRLEDELVTFFLEWPTSVYVAQLPDGYRRLMLHAVSQYLDLDARSFDAPGGRTKQRQTHVENNRAGGDVFVPPPTPLATYLHDNKAAIAAQA